jgi:HK97 gp10 family phage protein
MSQVFGDAHLRKVLSRIDPEITEEITDVLEKTGKEILEDMRAGVPVSARKGPHLRDDLNMRTARNGLSVRVGLLYLRTQRLHFYWRFIEHGTVKQPARPFAGPAFDRAEPGFGPRIRAAVNDALRRASSG